jgi:hypothetical protein
MRQRTTGTQEDEALRAKLSWQAMCNAKGVNQNLMSDEEATKRGTAC